MLRRLIPQLDEKDYEVIKVFVKYLREFEYLPLEIIIDEAYIPRSELSDRIRKLIELKILVPQKSGVASYRLTFTGLNLYALRKLADRNIVTAIGSVVGVGKESVVYIAKDFRGDFVAVKFYRIGWSSFKEFSRKRHYAITAPGHTWLVRSIEAAEREYSLMKKISSISDNIPRVYSRELNAVVMEYIDGKELYRIRELRAPEKIFTEIIDSVREVFLRESIVHGDLSPYNILVRDPGGELEKAYIFDWPQWVSTKDPVYNEVLIRDLRNIILFFKKRFRLDINLEKVYKYVVGGSETLEFK